MANIYTPVPPSELTAILRYILTAEDQQEQIDAQNGRIRSFSPWFGLVMEDGVEVEWDEALDTPYTPTAPFRSFDAPVPEGTLPGTQSKRASMIPTGIGYTVGELAILLQRISDGGNERELMLAKTDNQIRTGVVAIRNRMALAEASLVVNAGLTIDEYGVQETVTVGRDALNEITSATAWSDTANADPHDDELGAMERLENVYGLGWQDLVVVTDNPTYDHYRTIDAVASELNTNRILSGRPSRGEVNELREGRDLPPIMIMNRSIPNTNGTVTKLCPSNTWMIMPRPGVEIGKMQWGAPASLDLEGVDIAANERGGPIALIETNGTVPPRRRTVIDGLGMPYLQAPNWTVNLDTQAGL